MDEYSAASPGFAATVVDRGGVPVVEVRGELDLQSAPQLWEKLSEASGRTGEPPHVVADLGEVTFMDSSGLGVLIGHRNKLKEAGGDLWLSTGREDAVTRVIEVTGLGDSFRTTPTVQQAVTEIKDLQG